MSYFRIILILFISYAAVSVSIGQPQQPTDSPQLVESRELTAKVVKLYSEHKYEEALPLAKRALQLGEQALGKTNARLIAPLLNLGELYVAMLRLDEGRSSFERALSIAEASFGTEDLQITRPLDQLAFVTVIKGEHKKAAELFSRSLTIKKQRLPADDVEIARAELKLARAYVATHEYATAEPLYREAIAWYEGHLKKNDPELLEALRNYTVVLKGERKKDEATLVEQQIAERSSESGIADLGVLNSRAVKLVQPNPPQTPIPLNDIYIHVRVVVDEGGKVISATASGLSPFTAAAEEAARRSTFEPLLVSGSPVKMSGDVVYHFVRKLINGP